MPASILDDIVAQKKLEVRRLYAAGIRFTKRPNASRPFAALFHAGGPLKVIAEVKKASPSKGVIRADFDPVAVATAYERGGASAVSVLTDEMFFQGSMHNLTAVREAVTLPVLRKDFLIDPVQVAQAAQAGADAVLLIAAILSDRQLEELYSAATDLDMDPFIEVHNRIELDRVLGLNLNPSIIGVNNRDLATFRTDIQTTIDLMRHIPPSIAVIAESGIDSADDARRLKDAGVKGLLVGEALVRRDNPGELLKELMV